MAGRGRESSPYCTGWGQDADRWCRRSRDQLVFIDRLVATLIHLRRDLPHSVPGLVFGVDRSTATCAITEIRTLLAERGCAVPDRPGLRLRTLPDVFAYAQAEGIELRLDATEIQVRRPPAGRGGQRVFVSGKNKQNTMKATVIADWRGRTLWTDTLRPGRMHDATAARNNKGIAVCFQHFPDVKVLLDDGCLGLSRNHRGRQAITPPRKPRPGALPGRVQQWERDRHGALLRPHHRRTRPRRPQTLEATDTLDPPPRPPARHLPRHQFLSTGHAPGQTRVARYHTPTRKPDHKSLSFRSQEGLLIRIPREQTALFKRPGVHNSTRWRAPGKFDAVHARFAVVPLPWVLAGFSDEVVTSRMGHTRGSGGVCLGRHGDGSRQAASIPGDASVPAHQSGGHLSRCLAMSRNIVAHDVNYQRPPRIHGSSCISEGPASPARTFSGRAELLSLIMGACCYTEHYPGRHEVDYSATGHRRIPLTR